MLVIFALILALLTTGLCFWVDWKSRSPFVFIWMLAVSFTIAPIFLYWIQGGVGESSLVEALFFASVCNLGYLLAVFLIEEKMGFKVGYEFRRVSYAPGRKKDLLFFLLCLAIPIILVSNGLTLGAILESTLADKRSLTLWYLVILILSCSLFPQMLYALINRKKVLFVSVLFVFCGVALYFRSRSLIVVLLLPIAYFALFEVRKGVYWTLLVGVLAFLVAQLLKVIRYQGSLEAGLDITSWGDTAEYVWENNLSAGDLSIVSVFLKVIEDCGPGIGCGDWSLFLKLFSKFGLADFGGATIEYTLYDRYVEAGVNGSLHPTGYGFSYADGGPMFGVIYFVLLALVRLGVHRILLASPRNYLYIGVIMYFVMFFSRGSVYNSLLLLMLAFVVEGLLLLFQSSGRKSAGSFRKSL